MSSHGDFREVLVVETAPVGRTGRRRGRPDTRGEIVTAARNLFAARGYEGTSVRAVAAAAGVDAALVFRFFSTKEGLFRAVMEMPVDRAALMAELLSAGAEGVPRGMVAIVLRLWEGPETGPAMMSFMRRAMADPEATAMMRGFIESQAVPAAVTELLADVDPGEAAARIELMTSQLVGLATLRYVLKVEPLASMPAEVLMDAVAPALARYLYGEEPAVSSPLRMTRGPETPEEIVKEPPTARPTRRA